MKSLHQNYMAAVSRMASEVSVALVILQDNETVAAIARLVHGDDLESQKLALGAIAQLSEAEGFMHVAIQAGLMPIIVRLARSTHGDFGKRCLTALMSMTSDKKCLKNSKHLAQVCPDIFNTLSTLLRSIDEETLGCVTMTLVNLASEERYRREIVAAGALTPLLKLLQSRSMRVAGTAIALIWHLANTSGENDKPIIGSGCLERLMELLVDKKSPILMGKHEPPCRAIPEIFLLLLEREGNRKAILDMNLVQQFSSVILKMSPEAQMNMTQCFVKLSEQAGLQSRMLQMGIIDTMFQLVKSTTSTAIIMLVSNLLREFVLIPEVFVQNWATTAGGFEGYLVHLLESGDPLQSHMALTAILALMDEPAMKSLFEQADEVKISFLRMVELMEGITSDKALPMDDCMISMVLIEAAQVAACVFGW
ncbi:Vacuolar protein 8 [Mortierella alpina]|nr:Vacuolar protein 8 [Mortierella alpina]